MQATADCAARDGVLGLAALSCVGTIWHVSEPCDAAYLDYINRSAPWCPDLPVKERGTWAGQTLDAVQIDPVRGLAHFTRIGGGSNRTLHLAPIKQLF